MRQRSSGRTARTVVEIEWAGWSHAAISEEDPGEEDGLCYVLLDGGCCEVKSLHVRMGGSRPGKRAVL
jgi:hypothetical protein